MAVSDRKQPLKAKLENRIRAHLRAAMVENDLGLNETARLLVEDPGAITRILQDTKPRSPSAYLAHQISQVFGIKLVELFNDDPPDEFFRAGTPTKGEPRRGTRRYSISPPSGASPETARPGKRGGRGGGVVLRRRLNVVWFSFRSEESAN